jgi:type IV secretion system protein VirB8
MKLFRQQSKPAEKTRAEQNMEAFFDWDYDRNESALRRTRIAYLLAGLFGLWAFIATVGIAGLAPLKTIEPVFVRVDNATGAVDVLYNIEEETGIGRQDLLDKANLARYVRAREGYFYPIAKDAYREVMHMSVGKALAQYQVKMAPDNPESPVNRYEDHARVDIRIKSVSFLGQGLGQVRYIEEVENGDGIQRSHHVATIQYDYEPDASVPLSALADNAMGFAVSQYRAEPEDAS